MATYLRKKNLNRMSSQVLFEERNDENWVVIDVSKPKNQEALYANNIPARGIGGHVCTANSALKPSGFHNWAEFYQDGAWRIADPQKRVFMKNQSHYIPMKVIGESPKNSMEKFNRFRFEGDGLKVTMNQ